MVAPCKTNALSASYRIGARDKGSLVMKGVEALIAALGIRELISVINAE